MTAITLSHKAILRGAAAVHLTRATLTAARPKHLHDHDFFELLWVQNGTVRHHLPGGKYDLIEGDMLFVQPAHAHALQGRGEASLVVSITFHPDLIDEIAAAHPDLLGQLFWAKTTAPLKVTRDSRQLAEVNRAAMKLEATSPTRLAAEAFLLPICQNLQSDPILSTEAPLWLRDACAAALDPAVFRDGAAGLVGASGKAHAHVSRTMKQFSGQTPAAYTNRLRMEHAARLLTSTGDPLSDIAAEIGLPNLSHFHKQFRAHADQTPAQYRAQFQRHVVQPE